MLVHTHGKLHKGYSRGFTWKDTDFNVNIPLHNKEVISWEKYTSHNPTAYVLIGFLKIILFLKLFHFTNLSKFHLKANVSESKARVYERSFLQFPYLIRIWDIWYKYLSYYMSLHSAFFKILVRERTGSPMPITAVTTNLKSSLQFDCNNSSFQLSNIYIFILMLKELNL